MDVDWLYKQLQIVMDEGDALNGDGPEWAKFVAYIDEQRQGALLAEIDQLRTAWDRVGEVLADEGCSCDETDEHNQPVELSPGDRCFGHRIEAAWRGH